MERELNAIKSFYETINEHLEKGGDFHGFWKPKLEIFEYVDKCIKDIYNADSENSEKSRTQRLIWQPINQDLQNFKIESSIKINKALDELQLGLEYSVIPTNEKALLYSFLGEYKIYIEDPNKYSFYTLEPLKTERKDMILQVENEIKNRLLNFRPLENALTEAEKVEIIENRNYHIDTKISMFLGDLDKSKNELVIDRILVKYFTNKFVADANPNRLVSTKAFFESESKNLLNDSTRWVDLRHFLKGVMPYFTLTYEPAITEILEDIKILRHLGYFDDITPSVLSLIHSNFNLNDAKGMKINFVRVINTLYELNFFVNKDNEILPKKEVMKSFGEYLGVDLSNYDKDLSQAINKGESEKNIMIFDKMKEKMNDYIDKILNKKTD